MKIVTEMRGIQKLRQIERMEEVSKKINEKGTKIIKGCAKMMSHEFLKSSQPCS